MEATEPAAENGRETVRRCCPLGAGCAECRDAFAAEDALYLN
jgi:hypothetical protein